MNNLESLPRLQATALFGGPLRQFLRPVESALEKLLRLDRLRTAFAAARGSAEFSAFESLLRLLCIDYAVTPDDLARIPASGPAVLVVNHPYGFLEGAILGAMLPRIRPDVRFLANSKLATVPELQKLCIFVNPSGGPDARQENRKPMRECLEWLRNGGLLVIFPAGEVAHLEWTSRAITDPPWHAGAARLSRLAGCPVIPAFFRGANSLSFQLMGAVHPSLRTANLPRELLNKAGKSIELRIGRAVSAEAMREFPTEGEAIEYLRCRTYWLAGRRRREPQPIALPINRAAVPIAAGIDADLLETEIGRLAPNQLLCETEEMSVYLAGAEQIPWTLREIGRLRELTFRQVGEGTGREADLDRFDASYLHLFVHHKADRQLVGAYRLGATPDILPRHGVRGLYTSTLFHYDPELFRRVGPAIELGRSFVRAEYQRQYAPLLMLWKGIARYVAARPECPVLFGAASISNDYNRVSRDLLVRFLESHRADDLARFVKPRRPYRRMWGTAGTEWMCRFLADLEGVSDVISEVEADGKGVPILIRQYVKMGGRILGFNVDTNFSKALDGLVIMDLRDTPEAVLGRLMSRDAAAAFRRHHAQRCA